MDNKHDDREPDWEAGDHLIPKVAMNAFLTVASADAVIIAICKNDFTSAALALPGVLFFADEYNRANKAYKDTIYPK